MLVYVHYLPREARQCSNPVMDVPLPADLILGATLRGNEWGWSLSSFPAAVAQAAKLGYACLGGQFQFRLEDGSTCEMYWLNADNSADKRPEESWADYSRRSSREVLERFHHLVSITDFRKEALTWRPLQTLIAGGLDPKSILVFVAYFVTESDLA